MNQLGFCLGLLLLLLLPLADVLEKRSFAMTLLCCLCVAALAMAQATGVTSLLFGRYPCRSCHCGR